jgi:hypothetical protein
VFRICKLFWFRAAAADVGAPELGWCCSELSAVRSTPPCHDSPRCCTWVTLGYMYDRLLHLGYSWVYVRQISMLSGAVGSIFADKVRIHSCAWCGVCRSLSSLSQQSCQQPMCSSSTAWVVLQCGRVCMHWVMISPPAAPPSVYMLDVPCSSSLFSSSTARVVLQRSGSARVPLPTATIHPAAAPSWVFMLHASQNFFLCFKA